MSPIAKQPAGARTRPAKAAQVAPSPSENKSRRAKAPAARSSPPQAEQKSSSPSSLLKHQGDQLLKHQGETTTFDDGAEQVAQAMLLGGKNSSASDVIAKVRDAILVYWGNQTNRVTTYINLSKWGLRVWRFVLTGLRGTPLVGNAVNALAVLLDTAHASVRTRAHLNADPSVSRADLIADWTRVATDIGGVFDPLIGMAGAYAHTAYSLGVTAHNFAQNDTSTEQSSPETPHDDVS